MALAVIQSLPVERTPGAADTGHDGQEEDRRARTDSHANGHGQPGYER